MSEQPFAARQPGEQPEEPVPAWQGFFDDLFLLLALGIAVPTLSYLVWGLLELGSVPALR